MAGVFKATLMSALLLAMLALGTSEAKADPVTFSTSGTFTCAGCNGSGTNSVTFLGGMGNVLMITFNGLGSTALNTPTGSSFGEFQTFVGGTGASASGTFTLTITQTVPFAGSDSFSATFSGTFSASNSGTGVVTFTTTAITIGGVTYSITNNPLSLVPPASNNGITTVQGSITSDYVASWYRPCGCRRRGKETLQVVVTSDRTAPSSEGVVGHTLELLTKGNLNAR